MRKLLLSVITALLFIVPLNANANELEGLHYADGWFDHNPGKFTAPAEAVDNNLSTQVKSKDFEIVFNEEVNVKFVAFYTQCYQSNGAVTINFYNDANQVIEKYVCTKSDGTSSGAGVGESYVLLSLNDKIKKITFSIGKYSSANLREFEIFDQVAIEKVKNLKAKRVGFSDAEIEFELPSKAVGAKIFLNNVYRGTVKAGEESYTINGLSSNTTYEIGMTAIYEKVESLITKVSITTSLLPDMKDIKLSAENVSTNSATLVAEGNLKYVKSIFLHDENKKQLNKIIVTSDSVFKTRVGNLNAETKYKYYLRYEYANGEISDYAEVSFQTAAAYKEVAHLTASSTSNKVELTWTMPTYQALENARIYRKNNEKTGIVARAFSLFSNEGDGFNQLFETNGTSFKDLTVDPDTSYTYKVSTVSNTGTETPGKTINVQTKKINISGGGVTVDENGDYVVSWSTPTTGKMKVLVGGKEYVIVPASDKSVKIPKKDMVYNAIGSPDVKLVHIDDSGKETVPTAPGGNGGVGQIIGGENAGAILNADNLLLAGVALLGIVGAFLLLGLAFKVVPKLTKTIRASFTAKS